jgi:hypothetical protein
MPSIHDRDGLRPIQVKGDHTSSWVIITISIILFLIFWVFIIYILRSEPPPTQTVLQCAPGQCSTNIRTGVKNCPTDSNDTMTIDPSNQVCNSPFTCENSVTPFALQSDGSTNPDGVCQDNVVCKCLTAPQCAYYVTSIFNAQNGNPFQAIAPQRLVFEQSTTSISSSNNFLNQPPYQLSSSTTQFCAIPNEWLTRTWPLVVNSNFNPDEPINTQLGSCLAGVIAYVPENPSNFTSTDLPITPLSCVQGELCVPGTTPVWNNSTYQLDCMTL